MKTIRYINYFNLICGIILLWSYLLSHGIYRDYFQIAGLGLTIWYNWETMKQLKGQKNSLSKVNYIIGILTILFGAFMLLAGMGMIKEGLKENSTNALIPMGALIIPFGLATIFFTLKTLKYYKTV